MSAERIKAWQCIGCGRIEAQQTCIGICADRPAQFVYAHEYEALEALARQLATMVPREGQWEAGYRILQVRARALLGLQGALRKAA